jgi:hypothetical protein
MRELVADIQSATSAAMLVDSAADPGTASDFAFI